MIKVNLLPPEKRNKIRKARPVRKPEPQGRPRQAARMGPRRLDPWLMLPVSVGVLTLLLVGASFFWLGQRQAGLAERGQQLRLEQARLDQVLSRIETLKARNIEVRRRMELIVQLDRNRFLWPRILDEVSTALPRYTWLESIAELSPFPQLRLRIEGTTMDNLLLSQLLANLQRSELLTEVELVSSTEKLFGELETMYYIIECGCALNQPADTTQAAPKK